MTIGCVAVMVSYFSGVIPVSLNNIKVVMYNEGDLREKNLREGYVTIT